MQFTWLLTTQVIKASSPSFFTTGAVKLCLRDGSRKSTLIEGSYIWKLVCYPICNSQTISHNYLGMKTRQIESLFYKIQYTGQEGNKNALDAFLSR